MSDKKVVLVLSESSWLTTGYANHCRGILEGLHATGKYEIFEMGAYGKFDAPEADLLPWKYIPVRPEPGNENERRLYESDPVNVFGKWRFEEALLATRATCTISVRDPWMDDFIWKSPLRKFFSWVHCPTVDATPQEDEWLELYRQADALLTYTDWGADLLRGYGLEVLGSAPTGVDFNTFKPVHDKREHKRAMGIDPDSLVVGMASRNQPRKLFPDLIVAFSKLLDLAPREISDKLVLYLHTTYPDTWDLPRLVTEQGIGDRVLMTYICHGCGGFFPIRFRGARPVCPNCGSRDMVFPHTQKGVSREGLAAIYNLMDAYVMYSSCEGLGITQLEGAACGVPLLAVDFSAMSDVVRKVQGVPIKVLKLRREPETHRLLAVPDDDDLARQLLDLLSKPECVRKSLGAAARRWALEHYSWPKMVATWERAIDGLKPPELAWDSPPQFVASPPQPPEGLSGQALVEWGIKVVMGRPDLAGSLTAAKFSRGLDIGHELSGYDASTLMGHFAETARARNHWERRRTGQ